MGQTTGYDIAQILDSRRLLPVHYLVVAMSFSLMLIDGYDLICITFVAPLLQREWGFDRASFGWLFGAATLGTTIGPPIFGFLADRFGRKPMLVLGTLWFALFTLAAALASNLQQMVVLRLIAGIGIGGVIATAIAYVSEFAPARVRSTLVVMGVVGLALGGSVGALIASQLLGLYSWEIMFIIGGAAPLVVGLLAALVLPESPKYLALRPRRREELVAFLLKIAPEYGVTTETPIRAATGAAGFTLAALFRGRLAGIVPLLMLTTFLAQFALFFVNQWTTVLLTSAKVSVAHAAYATGAFQFFGFVGALAVMRPVDRMGFLPVPALFVGAAAAIGLMGLPGLGETALIALAGLAGFCVIGLQFGNIAATGQIFPTEVRSGGVGLIYGVGRFGSFIGPSLAGLLVAMQVPLGDLFHYAGALMLLGLVAGVVLTPLYRRQRDEINRVA